jgi:ATP-dependent Clp protease protease subunit
LLILENRDPKASITVYINSPGGSADSGFAMYDMMRFVRCPVKTVVNGLCASAAVLVFLGGAEKQRVSLPYSRFLIHQPSTMGRGSASDLRITAEQIVRMRERYNRIVAEATGKAEDEILEASARDFWLSAGEALEFGLIDRIVTHHQDL